MQSRLVVARGWEGRGWGMAVKGYEAPFWGNEEVLKLTVVHNWRNGKLYTGPGALEVKPVSQVKSCFQLVKCEMFIRYPHGILSRQL